MIRMVPIPNDNSNSSAKAEAKRKRLLEVNRIKAKERRQRLASERGFEELLLKKLRQRASALRDEHSALEENLKSLTNQLQMKRLIENGAHAVSVRRSGRLVCCSSAYLIILKQSNQGDASEPQHSPSVCPTQVKTALHEIMSNCPTKSGQDCAANVDISPSLNSFEMIVQATRSELQHRSISSPLAFLQKHHVTSNSCSDSRTASALAELQNFQKQLDKLQQVNFVNPPSNSSMIVKYPLKHLRDAHTTSPNTNSYLVLLEQHSSQRSKPYDHSHLAHDLSKLQQIHQSQNTNNHPLTLVDLEGQSRSTMREAAFNIINAHSARSDARGGNSSNSRASSIPNSTDLRASTANVIAPNPQIQLPHMF